MTKEKIIEDNLRLYAQKVSQAQEAERKRVSRDLHDETAQALVVVLRHLDDLANGKSRLSASDIREEVRKILEGIRRFSQELRPSILDDLGLIPAVKWLASDSDSKLWHKSGHLCHRWQSTPPSSRIGIIALSHYPRGLELTSGNTPRRLKLPSISKYRNTMVKINIRDNGKGFDKPSKVEDLTKKGKLGLIGIQERVQLLGGSLEIQTQPGKGTNLIITIPLRS